MGGEEGASGLGEGHQGRIVVERPSGKLQDRFCAHLLFVDGVERAQLRRGDRVEVVVDAGAHRVQARIDWVQTEPVSVQLGPGETNGFWVKAARGKSPAVRYLFSPNSHWIVLEPKREA